MKSLLLMLCLALAAASAGCKYNKETVPIDRRTAAIRVPNQQRIVALAVEQAVEALDFADLTGKSVSLELSGVFPHSDVDLLAYVTAQVQAKLSRQGVRVLDPAPVLMLPGAAPPATAPGAPPGPAAPVALSLSEPVDYRLLVGVSWGGIDTRDKVRTDEPLLTKQIGLGVGGLLAGLALLTLTESRYGLMLGIGSAVGSPIGAWYWSHKDTPFPHTYTLIGRVRIVANAVPVREGLSVTKEGSGESKIVVDGTSAEGFMLAP